FCFQAEDGIRDRNVTGVQTCALPICPTRTVNQVNDFISCSNGLTTTFSYYPSQRTVPVYLNNLDCRQTTIFLIVFTSNRNRLVEIGRASCREGAQMSVGYERGERKRA